MVNIKCVLLKGNKNSTHQKLCDFAYKEIYNLQICYKIRAEYLFNSI